MQKYIILFTLFLLMGCSKVDQPVTSRALKVTLEPRYEKPEAILEQEGVRYIKGQSEGEYLIMTVEGKIENVALIGVIFNEEAELEDGDVIVEIGDVEDEVIVIESYHAEGIPSERLVWETEKGERKSYTFVENGKDGLPVYIYYK